MHSTSPLIPQRFASPPARWLGGLLLLLALLVGATPTSHAQTLSVTSISPSSAAEGDQITISGTGFSGSMLVRFNGYAYAYEYAYSATELEVTVPSGAQTGTIIVERRSDYVQATSPGVLTVAVTPLTVSSISPSSVSEGDQITISGTGFGGSMYVSFEGSVSEYVYAYSSTELELTVPSGAQTGTVTVYRSSDYAQATGYLIVLAGPLTIASINPSAASEGGRITINGTGFSGYMDVYFGGGAYASEYANSSTELEVTVPSGAQTGTVTVERSSDAARATSTGILTVLNSCAGAAVAVTPAGPITLASGGSQTLTAQATLPLFRSGFDGEIYAVAQQPDGKLLAGGYFSTYNREAGRMLVRLNTNGTRDNTFALTGSGFNNTIMAVAVQPNGKVLVGGYFYEYNGTSREHIARLNADGTLDNTFAVGTGFNGGVQALVLQPDGKVLVVGSFYTYNGTARERIARLNADGTLDNTFAVGTGLNGAVNTLALQPDGKVLVAGNFASYNGTASERIVRLNANGTLDNTFAVGTGFNGGVQALVLQPDGKVLVGGGFSTYNGTSRNNIARLNANGTLDNTFAVGTGLDDLVYSLAVQPDGKVLVGGSFASYNSDAAAPDGLLRLTTTGTLDNTFNSGGRGLTGRTGYGPVVQADGKIVTGGTMTAYNTSVVGRMVRVNPDGTPDMTPIATPASYVWSPGGQTTASITVTQGGTYSVTATTTTGYCEVQSNSVTVALSPLTVSTGTLANPTAVPAGSYSTLTVTGTGVARLTGAVQVATAVEVQSGGTLLTNCQPLTGAGSFTLAAGSTLGICDAAGISTTGSTGAVQVAGSRSFSPDALYLYNGTAAQTTGSGLPATIRSLTISNTSGVALSASSTLTTALTLANGGLTTGSYALTLGSTATLTESASSYVTGTVQTTRDLSTAGANAFGGLGLTLAPAAGSTLPGLTLVRRTTGTARTGVSGRQGILRSFDIQPAVNTGLNVTLTFGYRDAELNGITETNLVLFKSETGVAGTWGRQAAATFDASANTATLAGVRDFSIWTLGSLSAPLPVELASFTAQAEGRTAHLAWSTASEKNSAYFAIERSRDGRAFEQIGQERGQGTKTSLTSYAFHDEQLLASLTYYRLRQVNTDGTFSYSPVRTVALAEAAEQPQLAVYPTVAVASQPVAYRYTGPALPANATLEVFDALGRLMGQQAAEAAGLLTMQVLPTGWYWVRLRTATGTVQDRFYQP